MKTKYLILALALASAYAVPAAADTLTVNVGDQSTTYYGTTLAIVGDVDGVHMEFVCGFFCTQEGPPAQPVRSKQAMSFDRQWSYHIEDVFGIDKGGRYGCDLTSIEYVNNAEFAVVLTCLPQTTSMAH